MCGTALDSGSRNELQPGHYIIRTLPPGEDYTVSAADMNDTGSAQITVYLTTDVPRTWAYSVNFTPTLHVRSPATVYSLLNR
jgi:hypothetical protein